MCTSWARPGSRHQKARKSPRAGNLIDGLPRNHFRLGFSSIPVDRIEPGLKLLGEIIRRQLKR